MGVYGRKISLSRTKADNRPLYGDYGAISQLMRIPNNVRLDDLKQYSDETHAHVNWTGPTASIRNPYYVLHQRQNSDERWRAFGYYSMKINFTDWLHLSAKYALTTTAPECKAPMRGMVSMEKPILP